MVLYENGGRVNAPCPNHSKSNIENSTVGLRILRLSGPLTLADLFKFQHSARAETQGSILIDLAGVPYMDSAGLGAVLRVMASCNPDRPANLA
jgi:anti-anti-sigma regulatory factor